MDERDEIERMFGPPQPGDPDFEPHDPARQAEALAALAAEREASANRERIAAALRIARTYGQIDGNHHKAWVIERMTAALEGRPADPGRGMAP